MSPDPNFRSPLLIDQDVPYVGNSPGDDGRGRAHVKVSNTASEPIPVAGTFSATFIPSGLTIAGKITKVTLNNSSWTALTPTPLANRNAMGIQNVSGQTVYYNYDNSGPLDPTTSIWIPNGAQRFLDIKGTIPIYAFVAIGTADVQVEEIS